ncbi:MAG: hypothetical protein CL521_00135 [Actinobacteria bacterium]|nr:hypothetical protein [Actinomycetota bacterium]
MSGSPSVTIQRQPRLKRINLTVIKDQIIVKGPINMRDKEAQNILNQHHSWVQKQLKAYQDLQKKYLEPQFITNATHFYLGNPYKLQFKPQSPPSIWLDNQTLIMAGYSEHNDNQGLQKALNKWYQDQARDILTDRVHIHAQKMNCQVNQIRIKSQKSRWGSCSSKKTLT